MPKNSVPYVIIVEDYYLLRQQLVEFLQEKNFDVLGVDGGDQLNHALKLRLPDILVLDLNLPGEDGLSIAKRVRGLQPSTGIIMMTARVTSADKVSGYESGADVYMTKPAKPEELLAAMTNLASRIRPPSQISKLWKLHLRESRLETPEGEVIQLTANELLIAEALVMSVDRKIHTDDLVTRLRKSEDDFSKNQLEAIISRLRKKISAVGGSKDVIRSVWGYGYQLCINCSLE